MTFCVIKPGCTLKFQSTCHIRGMTAFAFTVSQFFQFQSTCHIRGMTLDHLVVADSAAGISIHMPHTWHDGRSSRKRSTSCSFQSTCHIRGMTAQRVILEKCTFISIHMPHTWHDDAVCLRHGVQVISIHMPHTWHDVPNNDIPAIIISISIHMPHTWHDVRQICISVGDGISIHMPHTWHDVQQLKSENTQLKFQSTCHIRGMTKKHIDAWHAGSISIHMPHTWHDRSSRSAEHPCP